MKKWNKKGFTLNDLPSVAIVFLVSTLFLVFAMLVLTNMQTSSLGVTTETVVNESITMPSSATGSVTLAHAYLKAITSIKNATTATIPAANYTISNSVTGVVTFALSSNTSVAGCSAGDTCRVTYTYETYGETKASIAVNNTLTALQELPNNWFLIIALVIAAVVVIGVVMNNLGTFGNTGGRR